MIVHPQLQNFANNIAQQQAALSDMRGTMLSWKNSTIGKIQRQYILKAGESSTAQNCINNLKPLFGDLSWLYAMMGKLCDLQSTNPFANIELRSSKNDKHSTVILHQERKFSIQLCIAKSRSTHLKSTYHSFIFGPDSMMIAPIGNTQIVTVQLDANDNICSHTILSCHDGELYIYNNNRQSINFIAQANNIIFLRAIIKTGVFDDSSENISHHYLQFNGDNQPHKQLANETLSRAQLIFSILRHQQIKKAIPLFAEWVRNETPDMRWYVMREFLALDIEAALPHLLSMADYDENRSVRKAALDTLQILKTQYPEFCVALQA